MKRLPALTLVFAIAFAVLLIGPPFLGKSFGPYPLMKVADVFDIITPAVLLPLYWLLYRMSQKGPVNLSGIITFFVFAAFWAEGQGMHLSANSIGHLLEGMEGSDIYKLTNFYDEVLSHYMWHFGIVGLSALLIFRQWRNPVMEEQTPLWPPTVAGVIHGVTFALIVLEGQTVPLGVPFAVLAVLFGLVRGRKKMRRQPVATFFFVSYALATIFLFAWRIYWGSWLEPLEAIKRL